MMPVTRRAGRPRNELRNMDDSATAWDVWERRQKPGQSGGAHMHSAQLRCTPRRTTVVQTVPTREAPPQVAPLQQQCGPQRAPPQHCPG